MASHPFANVAISAVHNTRSARVLDGYTSLSLSCEAALAVAQKAGLDLAAVDGIAGPLAPAVAYHLGIGPVWTTTNGSLPVIAEVASAIAAGIVSTVIVVNCAAGIYTERASTAPWTRPSNEFTAPFGLFTVAEFALMARPYMERYGVRPEHMAKVAATIRNNGHVNPEAVYFGRGPYTVEDILSSRIVADPYRLLDCCTTSEGGCAIVMTTSDRAGDLAPAPAYLLGFGMDMMGPAYELPPAWDLRSTVLADGEPLGQLGRRAARQAFAMAGLRPSDVDTCELYDNFSLEIIRQLEAFGFCEPGEGGDFVMDGNIDPGGRYPVTTDGGLLSFNHSGAPPALQRVVRAVQQVRGECATSQVPGANVAITSSNGAAALRMEVALFGNRRP